MNDFKETNGLIAQELFNERVEKLTASIEKLNGNIVNMDKNSAKFATITERVTWILVFLALAQLVLLFFPLLSYPGFIRLLILFIIGIALIYLSKHIVQTVK